MKDNAESQIPIRLDTSWRREARAAVNELARTQSRTSALAASEKLSYDELSVRPGAKR